VLKIDKKLQNFVILSEKACVFECIVYYNNKFKTMKFLEKNKIKILCDLNFINAYAVCCNSAEILMSSRQSFISFISSVANVFSLINVSKKIIGVDYCYGKGKDITVAYIDTGINSHIDFTLGHNRIIKFVDFVNGYDRCYDDNGHGTFVAGVSAGNGIFSCGLYAGIAPMSNIISLKALNGKGEATAVKILEAMQWVYDNHKKYNIKVVCMSFGSEPLGVNDPIMIAAESLWQEGITMVCAGGNSGPEMQTIKSPGISKKIITVGGLDDKRDGEGNYNEKDFDVANFSSRGPAFGKIKPDIIAPSVNIVSCCSKGGYSKMSGTSVAAPIVAGVCALIYEKYPNVTPNQIKKFLLLNAKDIKKSKFSQGYGIINLLNNF